MLLGVLVVTAWVQRHALGTFFSSPDDLIHLQQAAGLRPTLPTPFRFLSQVLYFRGMLRLFGTDPFPYHVVTFVLHGANVVLAFALARSFGIERVIAGLAAGFFGAFPLFLVLLSSAVGVNDELALTLALASLLVLRAPRGSAVLACALFAGAILCKESVILLFALAFVPGEGEEATHRRVAPLVGVAAAAMIVFFLLRPSGLAPDRAIYAMSPGSNVLHNWMTYLSWSFDLRSALPDLVSSYDTNAWRWWMWPTLGLGAAGLLCGRRERAIGLGLLWWLAGLLPVLPLRFQTFRHYLYPALFGLALVVAAVLSMAFRSIARALPGRVHAAGLASTLAALGLLAYAVRSEQLVVARLRTRVPGTQLSLDPVIRRREVAQRAIGSVKRSLRGGGDHGGGHLDIVILSPEGSGKVLGARSGREYHDPRSRAHGYDLLQESLDHGNALSLFLPEVDSVAFVPRWSRRYDSFRLFLPYQDGSLAAFAPTPDGYAQAGAWMIEQKMYRPALAFLDSVIVAHPTGGLKLVRGLALFKLREKVRALEDFRAAIELAPGTPEALAARSILEADERGELELEEK